jgi:hypothetical protein
VARRKIHVVRKNQTRDKDSRRVPKGQMDMKGIWMGAEYKTGIKDPGTRWELGLKIERT